MRRWQKKALEIVQIARHFKGEFPRPALFEGATPTARRIVNYWRLAWETYRLTPIPRSLPARLCIEATSACNLACPHCLTGAGEIGRPGGALSLEFYRQLLAELANHLWHIEFHNWGEPLLHKRITTMVAEATARGLSTSLCTNFSLPFDAGSADALVRSGLKIMGVSIDGARQETYEQYRVGGQLARVLHNCRLVVDAKRRLGSPTPRLLWNFHMFAHNVDDVAAARAAALTLGIPFDVSRGRVVGPDWDPAERFVAHDAVFPMACYTLFHTAVVYADGSVAPCRGSFYAKDDLGRIAADGRPGAASFRDVWRGEGFQTARRLFRERTATRDTRERICFNCPALLDWHRYRDHLGRGGDPADWRPAYDSNQRFNYFWTRGPVRRGLDESHRRASPRMTRPLEPPAAAAMPGRRDSARVRPPPPAGRGRPRR